MLARKNLALPTNSAGILSFMIDYHRWLREAQSPYGADLPSRTNRLGSRRGWDPDRSVIGSSDQQACGEDPIPGSASTRKLIRRIIFPVCTVLRDFAASTKPRCLTRSYALSCTGRYPRKLLDLIRMGEYTEFILLLSHGKSYSLSGGLWPRAKSRREPSLQGKSPSASQCARSAMIEVVCNDLTRRQCSRDR